MKDDVVMRLLREVKAGKVSIEDARVALEDEPLSAVWQSQTQTAPECRQT